MRQLGHRPLSVVPVRILGISEYGCGFVSRTHVLDLQDAKLEAKDKIAQTMVKYLVDLSKQKFSSNVIEKVCIL